MVLTLSDITAPYITQNTKVSSLILGLNVSCLGWQWKFTMKINLYFCKLFDLGSSENDVRV